MTSTAAQPELAELSTTAIATGVRDGSVSVRELADALLARIERYDGRIEAFSYLRSPDAIRADADALDAEAKAGTFRGPLHGVPFGIKEQFALGGVATRGDWKDESPPIAAEDATTVARLTAAGGLLFGKLYMVGPSGTPPSRNPWNTEYSPGGSSSGSGAAVGARFVPFALSEQTAGSGIRPAAYCGVAGLKPTYGRNSRRGMFTMAWSHDHACIIAQDVPGLSKVFAVTSGHDPLDPTSLPMPPADEAGKRTAPPRIGVVRNFFPELTEPAMQQAIEAAAKRLGAAGADVVDMQLPQEFGLAWPMWAIVGGAEGITVNARADAAAGRGISEPPKPPAHVVKPASKFGMLGKAAAPFIPASYYLHAQRLRRWLQAKVDAEIAGYDAILMATAPGPAPYGLESSGDWSLLLPWSHLGNPAVSIPAGLSPEGMPLGLQLVAPNMADESLLSTAAWCEDVLGRLPAPVLKNKDEE